MTHEVHERKIFGMEGLVAGCGAASRATVLAGEASGIATLEFRPPAIWP